VKHISSLQKKIEFSILTTNNIKGERLDEKGYSDFKRKLNAHYSVQKEKKQKSEKEPVSIDLSAESKRIEDLLGIYKEVNQFKDVDNSFQFSLFQL